MPERSSPLSASGRAPSFGSALAAAAQISVVAVAPLILLPLLVLELVEAPDDVASKVVFVSMVVCALTTLMSAVGVGPLRSRNPCIAIVDPVSIPMCVLALDSGGAAALAALVVVCGLFQVLVGLRLSVLHRIVSPSVTVALLVLACISAVPVFAKAAHGALGEGFHPLVPGWMVAVGVAVHLLGRRGLASIRPWAAPAGLAAGIISAAAYGHYDLEAAAEAAWIGVPMFGWNILGGGGLGQAFGGAFFLLLPSFLILSLVLLVRTHTVSVVAQTLSSPAAGASDFREVQRANSRVGMGSMLSGLGGSTPLVHSPASSSAVLVTGCDPRQLAALVGGFLLLVAFCPKFQAVLVAIPKVLIGVYLVFILLPLIVRLVSVPGRSAARRRLPMIVAVPVLTGLLFESGAVSFAQWAGLEPVSNSGLTAGSIVLLAMAVAQSFYRSRRRVEMDLDAAGSATVRQFVGELASKHSWGERARGRVEAAGEEALMILVDHAEASGLPGRRRVRLTASVHGSMVELEFVGAPTDAPNLEERLALLDEPEGGMLATEIERDAALRLLGHFAASVSHRQYQEAEILTVAVSLGRGPRP